MRARDLMRGVLALAGVALLAACSSVGGARPSARPPASQAPVVRDPAPIVSGTMRPYQVRGRWYRPEEQPNYDEVGMASWYGSAHDGRPTSTGERFDMTALTAAHKTLPLPGLVEVTNLETGQRVVVRINDRGPFAEGRIIDLSREAADELGLLAKGVGRVRVRYLGRAPRLGGGGTVLTAEARTPLARSSAPAAAVSSAQAGPFWVQAGSFSDAGEARRIADRLSGWVRADAGAARFRVVVGPWDDANAAERGRQAVVARGYADALLISGS
ncbi:septal ring lytic transglycosylase RlpA family protein [uncultured Brevundimonas sp.]|uniref:septal ring lytic transglycosylase RlpA family protein n=1 Tax=uncultured Brevundimonas sp. TaxID=213418 RepID=UPI002595B132|nr:septal ring lytic transglycosylase RlpA family protein [uncultured Brevundimonas sp.]